MITVDKKMLIHTVDYYPFLSSDKYHAPTYGTKQIIDNCRVDIGREYSKNRDEAAINIDAVIFCYKGLTVPLPDFKEQSKITFDGQAYIIEKVIPLYEPYKPELFGYELEVTK